MEASKISGSASKVLMALRMIMSKDGVVLLTNARVSRITGLSRPTSAKVIEELKEIGAIKLIDKEGYVQLVEVKPVIKISEASEIREISSHQGAKHAT